MHFRSRSPESAHRSASTDHGNRPHPRWSEQTAKPK
jgi:hypothetical protein